MSDMSYADRVASRERGSLTTTLTLRIQHDQALPEALRTTIANRVHDFCLNKGVRTVTTVDYSTGPTKDA